MKKMGRPRSEDPKITDVQIRMSKAELELLRKTADLLGVTRTEVIRRGIKKVYDEISKENG